MRNNEEFKAEVIRRSNVYIKKRKKRIIASCVSLTACIMIFSAAAVVPSLVKSDGMINITSSFVQGEKGNEIDDNIMYGEYHLKENEGATGENYTGNSSSSEAVDAGGAPDVEAERLEYNAENITAVKIEMDYISDGKESVCYYTSKEKLKMVTQLINSLPINIQDEESTSSEEYKECTITITNNDGNEDVYVFNNDLDQIEIFISGIPSD